MRPNVDLEVKTNTDGLDAASGVDLDVAPGLELVVSPGVQSRVCPDLVRSTGGVCSAGAIDAVPSCIPE